MTSKYKRYGDRIRELITEGESVALLEKRSEGSGSYIQGGYKVTLVAWLVPVDNIIHTVFDTNSAHARHFDNLTEKGVRYIAHSYEVLQIVGLLTGALDDLENVYLLGQEFLVAGVIFDSVLEEA